MLIRVRLSAWFVLGHCWSASPPCLLACSPVFVVCAHLPHFVVTCTRSQQPQSAAALCGMDFPGEAKKLCLGQTGRDSCQLLNLLSKLLKCFLRAHDAKVCQIQEKTISRVLLTRFLIGEALMQNCCCSSGLASRLSKCPWQEPICSPF